MIAGEDLLKFCQNNDCSALWGVSNGEGVCSYSAEAALVAADADAFSHLSLSGICNPQGESLHAAVIPEQLSTSKFEAQLIHSSLFTSVLWG